MSTKQSDWWVDFFPAFRPVFDALPARNAKVEANFIAKKLALKPGMKFLDCPCGIGRISIPLAKVGIKVTGVDITRGYIEELAIKAKKLKLPIALRECDMRKIDFDSEFDAAGNLGTSLGYFEKEPDDLLALKKLYKAVKPTGRVLIQISNRDWIVKNFCSRDWLDLGKLRILQHRQFDFVTSTNIAEWRFLKDGEENVFKVRLRVYSFHELYTMLSQIGFADIRGYGSVKEEPIGPNNKMMYIIGTKPKR